jgi:hypothetical protein
VKWQAIRVSGGDALAARASKKLRSDESLVLALGSTVLRNHMEAVPLWRGSHVEVRQLVDDFARYLYLPRVAGPEVLIQAIRDGVSLLTWRTDTFAYAESFDEAAGRYRGLRCGEQIAVSAADPQGLLVRPEVAAEQYEAERVASGNPGSGGVGAAGGVTDSVEPGDDPGSPAAGAIKTRYHGTVELNASRVGRDAGRIAEEVIAHLVALPGARVSVTLEVSAHIPEGVPDNVVRTVTENGQTLKFETHGFEKE